MRGYYRRLSDLNFSNVRNRGIVWSFAKLCKRQSIKRDRAMGRKDRLFAESLAGT